MKALITGASSGIGRDVARVLAEMGWELYLVARRTQRLEELQAELATPVTVIGADLSDADACREVYAQTAHAGIDLLINNAGFGLFGAFDQTSLETELCMIDTNIRAVHILSKLFAQDFVRRGSGRILNVASSAAFFPGPLMAAYYASKAYVLRLSEALCEELRRKASGVTVSVLCPGPVRTEFDARADVRFSVKGLNSMEVARYAIRKTMCGKLVIVPGFTMKCAHVFGRFLPDRLLARAAYHMQKRKTTPQRKPGRDKRI